MWPNSESHQATQGPMQFCDEYLQGWRILAIFVSIACSNVSLSLSCTFFLLIFHQNSFCCSMYLLFLMLLLWTFEKILALSSSPISHLMTVESNQVPSELCPGWPSAAKPLLIYQVLSHSWLFTGLPACLSYTLGTQTRQVTPDATPQAD